MHLKVPSTPADPSRAVLEGLGRIAPSGFSEGDRVAHGTTVATNALLTGNVAASVLITTTGFEDVLEIGRQDRPALYDLEVSRPEPLIRGTRRFGVPERIGPEGQVEQALAADDPAIGALLNLLADLDPPPDSVAVCLLHAYANPEHEEVVARALGERFPDLPVSLSSRLTPVFREYERTSTVAVNAAVRPVMERYLDRLRDGVGTGGLIITASSGGALAAERAAREPVHTLLSGPAAGVAGALAVARRAGLDRILTFDMGGTSTDVALCDGAIGQTSEGIVGGYPVQVPQVDLHTVGAGGGSLARIDRGGALVVGPDSAGADPGPLAYGNRAPGKKGEGVTVTDANLLLGRLPASGLLGGQMALDEVAARLGIERLAEAAQTAGASEGTAAEMIAEGIVRVAVTSMAGALRRISVERGKDPRDYVLVAFGGAGAMHAAALAREMGMDRLLVPREPGLLSAVGTLVAGLRIDRAHTVLGIDPVNDAARAEEEWRSLEREVTGALESAGAPESGCRLVRTADLRYRGQSFELTVVAPDEAGDWESLQERFGAAHRERYGYEREGAGVELVSLRVEGHGPSAMDLDDLLPPVDDPIEGAPSPADSPERLMIWDGRPYPAPQIRRETLAAGEHLRGPAIIHEFSATTVVPPDADVEVGRFGDLLISIPAISASRG
jgi:N-methylhydantoinase A